MRFIAPLIGVFLLFGGLVLGYRFYIDWRISSTTARTLDEIKRETELKKKAYNELLARQEQQSKTEKIVYSYQTLKAKGGHKIFYSFVFPSSQSKFQFEALYKNLIASCPLGSCDNLGSLNYIDQFYNNEAKKYNVDDFNLFPTFGDPVIVPELIKVGDMANVWQKDPFGVSNLTGQFEKLLPKDPRVFNKDDLAVFLYFDNSQSPEADRFYDTKHFRSFADEEKKRAYVNLYSSSPLFGPIATEIVAHEVLHLFGASDKYSENPKNGICTIKGHGEITPIPTYFQTTSDIMCGYIETSKGKFKRAGFEDKTLVINQITAREIGWIE